MVPQGEENNGVEVTGRGDKKLECRRKGSHAGFHANLHKHALVLAGSSDKAIQSEFRRAIFPRKAPLGLTVRLWVAKSTATMPNFGSKPDIHSKLSSNDQAT
jgi:hypothetical protein